MIKRLQQGQEAAFQILVKQYQSRLMAIAWGITLDHEESLEIVQDVFFNVYRNINEFRGDAGLMTWMRKITVNLCLNWKRRWKRRFKWHHVSLDSGDTLSSKEENASPESHYLNLEMEKNIMAHVARLPEKIRTVFILKTVEDMSYEAIAQMLNIKPGTVSSRLYHARKSLAGALKREAS
ncbi:RNA polymerase, sigma-24 subunit, RpoE [Desulfocicer vacuolatum DSM 3385]|uniref:RNA polymerase, sigma-24 subunit, RpoE n=1 Tax=Desulfocicer vacuolatum DSM 3385 TaxID=1121400 RepID=A0A1W2A2R3_9BACT|nr:sigma-70 family RNA polymerase sigma factor [Desulfocicer vacuolatum]SMC54955.1 RNA polymerase, sigma-24 subunit, RpoE [Desulfocicer vacuolatum DSM 3385]